MMGLQREMIVAVDVQGGFSKDGEIPWYISDDFKHFREITEGGICVMGKDTYVDIDKRQPEGNTQVLPNRHSYVISSTLDPSAVTNAQVVKSLDELMVGMIPPEDYDSGRKMFFIGGKSIFDEAINHLADVIHLTLINKDYECDKRIDRYNLMKLFSVVNVESHTTDDGLQYAFVTHVRKR